MKEIQIKTAKEQFLADFEERFEEDFMPKSYTDAQRKRIAQLTSPVRVRTGIFTSIPMTCTSERCPFNDTCPLYKESIEPTGFPCPLEWGMVKHFMAAYMEQLDVEPDNMVEMSFIRDIVDQEVQYLRKTKILGKEDFIQQNVVGVDANGDPVFQKQLHLAVELEDRLHKRRQSIFKQLLATRESKAKVGMANLEGALTMSKVVSEINAHQRKLDEGVKRKLGIVEDDAYIQIPPENVKDA